MKKILLVLLLLVFTKQAYADTYISPERYAVNEADYMDYTRIAPPKPLNVDTLDDDRFQAPNLVEKDFSIGSDDNQTNSKKQEKKELEPYQKRLSYKIAKWWVDQRYKREEPHHGALHEIKVEKRMLYEQKEQEKLLQEAEAEKNNK